MIDDDDGEVVFFGFGVGAGGEIVIWGWRVLPTEGDFAALS